MLNNYEKLIEESKKKQMELNLDQYKQIRNLYIDVAKSLQVKANKAKKGSLTERWAKDYTKSVISEIKQMNIVLEGIISENIKKSAENAKAIQLDFFDQINMRYGLEISKSFKNMFSSVPNDVIKELVSGDFYKDGRGLSERIWFNGKKINGDIDYIIQKGIAEKKSAYELAEDLQTYVNPEAKKEWQWKKVYHGTAKTIDYNAQRLARTSISHAYTLSMIKSCEKNPFTNKIRWHSVFAPGRTCPLCKERDGKEYLLKDCPVDHPNGLCYQEPLLDDSLENIGSRLNSWVKGGSDKDLDDWYDKYGDYFAGESDKIIKNQSNNHIIKENKYQRLQDDYKKVSNNRNYKSNIKWENILDINENNAVQLNDIHASLNKYMKENKKEKLVMLNIDSNDIVHELEGTKDNEVAFNKETINQLKNSTKNSIILTHNHPSNTTFSRQDIEKIIRYPSIKALTLECIDGSKYSLERGNFKSSFIKTFTFFEKYDKIYNKLAEKFPQLNDEVEIYNIWDKFLDEVTKEVAKEYNLIYKKVE